MFVGQRDQARHQLVSKRSTTRCGKDESDKHGGRSTRHRRDIGEVDRQRLATYRLRRRRGEIEVNAFQKNVFRNKDPSIAVQGEECRVVSDAERHRRVSRCNPAEAGNEIEFVSSRHPL